MSFVEELNRITVTGKRLQTVLESCGFGYLYSCCNGSLKFCSGIPEMHHRCSVTTFISLLIWFMIG